MKKYIPYIIGFLAIWSLAGFIATSLHEDFDISYLDARTAILAVEIFIWYIGSKYNVHLRLWKFKKEIACILSIIGIGWFIVNVLPSFTTQQEAVPIETTTSTEVTTPVAEPYEPHYETPEIKIPVPPPITYEPIKIPEHKPIEIPKFEPYIPPELPKPTLPKPTPINPLESNRLIKPEIPKESGPPNPTLKPLEEENHSATDDLEPREDGKPPLPGGDESSR